MGEQVPGRSAQALGTGAGGPGGLFTYFAYGDSLIHRLDPRTKGLWVVVGMVYIFGTDDWRLLLFLVVLNVVLTLVAGQQLDALLPIFKALVLFGIVILIFQLLFQGGEAFYALGPIKLHTSAFPVTRRVWFRLANLSLFFVQFMMWTHPVDLALMWKSFGIPDRYGMMGGLALRFFPIFQQEVVNIQDAQKVRGQPLHTIWQKIAGMLTIYLPFVLRVLRRTNEISLAMEMRGFGYKDTRTYSREIGMGTVDWILVAFFLSLLLGRAAAPLLF